MTLKAITQKEFEINLSTNFTFEDQPHIGLCISGGSDSMALLMLMRRWIKRLNGRISAFHFDHNLRKKSGLEAITLEKKLKRLKVNFVKVKWNHEKIKTRIMERARDARYENIINQCKKMKIIHLMTAHNLEDNLETYLMRKKRSNSSLGLSSIPKIRIVDNVRIIRPLLFYKKRRLEATCRKFKIKWIEDESNNNQKFERVRTRNLLKLKTFEEIEKISDELKKKKAINLSTEKKISLFFCKQLKFDEFGVLGIDRKKLTENSIYLQIEILKKILTTAAGKDFSPKKKSIFEFLKLLKKYNSFNFTLHTCLLKVCHDDIKIHKEILEKHKSERFFLRRGEKFFWQKRFVIESSKYDIEFENITLKNWPFLKEKIEFQFKNLNFLTIQSLPVFTVNNFRLVPFLSDKKFFNKFGIEFNFKPKIPLQKKNFF